MLNETVFFFTVKRVDFRQFNVPPCWTRPVNRGCTVHYSCCWAPL